MKPTQVLQSAGALISMLLGASASGADPRLSIQPGTELSWPTTLGNTYQLQAASLPAGPWANLSVAVPGDGQPKAHGDFSDFGFRHYRILETVPGIAAPPVNPVNGGFESGNGVAADKWTTAASQPPTRTNSEAHSGSHSMRCSVVNVGAAAAEGLLSQMVVSQGGSITGGQTYNFSFWAKQVSSGPSYIQQYEVQWRNASGSVVGGSGLQNFSGVIGTWTKITVPNLAAPANAVEARVSFRFVTGAVAGGHGEVLLDDISLVSSSAPDSGTPATVNALSVSSRRVARISWPSKTGISYRPVATTNFVTWTPLQPLIDGDGGTKEFTVPMSKSAEFFRLEMPIAIVLPPVSLQTTAAGGVNSIGLAWSASPTPGVTGYRILYGTSSGNLDQSVDVGNVTAASIPDLIAGQTYFLSVVALTANGESLPGDATLSAIPNVDSGIVALYNSSTVPEAATTVNTPTALITRLADRARDRHAREAQFNSYDHYLSWYWEQRMANIEIIDRVGKAGQPQHITFNYTTQDLLNPAEFRTFFRGIGTVAEYNNNQIAALVSTNPSATPGETDYHYTATITQNGNEGNRALQLGDRVEIEISMFLNGPRNGRLNYYGTTLLYIVGQGIVPWAQGNDLGFPGGVVGNVNRTLDSHPLPTSAWLGGLTTLPYQYSNEPEHRFKQLAGNISPTNGQSFMLGRRLHHTDFGNGVHSESGNPVFSPHIGKLGPKFIARSCVECHVNNGRALPPDIGAPMLQSVVKVGSNATGSPHPQLGSVLQPRSTSGPAEATATIANYTNLTGQYGDGTSYSLRKPNYTFQGVTPSFYSVRLTPPLVGMGLLEAVAESTITALADPADANQDGISGRLQKISDPQIGDQRLGRFTNKASSARVSHQVASALNTDMGVTTPVFPMLDGETTAGPPEISTAELDKMTRYVALLGIGARRDLANPQAIRGEQVFASSQCVKCHTPDMTTGPHHPMAELRNQTIHPYTDLLLHDMGLGLADNMGEGAASGPEWRTPPLWGIGLTAGVSGGEAYLHDGRARTLEEAILWHGGEAEASKEAFRTLPTADRAAVIRFLKSL
ncbi:MAG: di-heme oxidoredictase family protein [Luteolibacter sp.]